MSPTYVSIINRFECLPNNPQIGTSAHFANDLGLDSLDTVEVVMAIEEEFSIEIPDKDADSIHSGISSLPRLEPQNTVLTTSQSNRLSSTS
ncbi:hypothetical protein Lal_00004255 [Lupinus albus]|nr:hypothetical protein Lal_00004255 [Lupinus albus]